MGEVAGAPLGASARWDDVASRLTNAEHGVTKNSFHAAAKLRGSTTRRGVLSWLTIGTGMLATGCGLVFRSNSFRQRITVEIQTPWGISQGSSVVETTMQQGKSWGDSSGVSFSLIGEAVAVSLPGGGILFALLRRDNTDDAAGYQARLFINAMKAGAVSRPRLSIDNDNLMKARDEISIVKPTIDIPKIIYPKIIGFTNPHDLRSVTPINLLKTDSFLGVKLLINKINLSITDDPVTRNIEKILPLFDLDPKFEEWSRGLPYGSAKAISVSDFIQGYEK